MDIALYITELLHQHDEVSIPGAGTFYKQHVPAIYHQKTQSFTPPGKLPAFKQSFTTNTLLADYISLKKNISSNSSVYFVQKFSDNLQSLLQSSGYANIAPLGVLRYENDTYYLEASGDLYFENSSFGLKAVNERAVFTKPNTGKADDIDAAEDHQFTEPETFAAPFFQQDIEPADSAFNKIIGEPDSGTTESRKDDRQTEPADENIVEVAAHTEENTVIADQEEKEERKERADNKTKSMIAWLIVFVVVAGSAIYLFYPQLNQLINNQRPASVQKQTAPQTIEPDTLISEELPRADSIAQKLAENGFSVEKPRDTVEITTKSELLKSDQTVYEVIVASLNRKADADKILKTLSIKGIDSYLVYAKEKRRNNILISIGSFNDKRSANAELLRVKREMVRGAYIYDHKKTAN